jgi:hypothetical protein
VLRKSDGSIEVLSVGMSGMTKAAGRKNEEAIAPRGRRAP